MRFEDTATNLMLADPSGVVAYRSRKEKRSGASISATLSGRGKTGVDLRWYPAKEFKELNERQKDELMTWRQSDEGKKVIADGRAQAKAKRTRLSKKKVDAKNVGGGGGSGTPSQRKRKYQNKVAEAAKKLLASSLEAEKVSADAMDVQVKASMQRIGADVSAAAVIPPAVASSDEVKEKAVKENQTIVKLSSVLSRIKVGKNKVDLIKD